MAARSKGQLKEATANATAARQQEMKEHQGRKEPGVTIGWIPARKEAMATVPLHAQWINAAD
eukprot:13542927-Alexandrium_andersonii.AAC.1